MSRQAVQVEIAFTATPFADPSTLTWTDVSSKVLVDQGVSLTRGKPNELPAIQAGTVSLVLDNRTGNFDPDNQAGAYWPLVTPIVPIRISATSLGTTCRIFTGFVESWAQSWSDMLSMCTITAVDATQAILSFNLGTAGTYAQQLTGARVNAVLDSVGWPTTLRAIDLGTCLIQAQSAVTNGSAPSGASLLQDAVNVEGGLFFIAADGKATFWDQAHAPQNILTTVDQGIEGAGAGMTYVAQTNCAVAATSVQALDGTWSLRLSSTAAGAMSARGGRYPAVANQSYGATAWFRAGAAVATPVLQVEFFNAALALIGSGSAVVAAPDTNTGFSVAQVAPTLAPVGTVWVGIRVGYASTAGASELHYIDRLGVFTVPLGANVLTVVDQSFEAGVGSFTGNLNCTVSSSTTQALDGTHSLRLSSTAAGFMEARSGLYPASPGMVFVATANFRAGATVESCTAYAQFFDSTGNAIAPQAQAALADTTTGWTPNSSTPVTAPGGTTFVAVALDIGTTAGVAELHYVDRVSLQMTPAAMTIGDNVSLGEVPYQPGPVVSKDDSSIRNVVTLSKTITDGVSAANVVTQTGSGVSKYNTRAYSVSAPWATNADMTALAVALAFDYSLPSTRMSSVSVDGVQTGAFATLITLDLGAYVAVNIRPRSSGPTIAVFAVIQGFSLNITATSWLWTFNLSPTIAGH